MKKSISLLAATIAASSAVSALAADEFSATVALKAWATTSSKYIPVINGVFPNRTADIEVAESSRTTAWIPSVSIRYKDFMVGGSHFAKKAYNYGLSSDFERQDYDLVAGYYVLPTLAIIAGYKEIKQDFRSSLGNPQEWKYSGPIIGFSASAPLTAGFSLYGSAAIGALKFRPKGTLADFSQISPLFAGGFVANSDADYGLGEVGIAYAFDPGKTAGLNALIATLGYRSQTLLVKQKGRVVDSSHTPATTFGWDRFKARDSTEGVTLSIIGAF